MKQRQYRICSRCVMDTTDPAIVFDENGVCNHCHRYDANVKANVFSGSEGIERLSRIVDEMKAAGKEREYDCVIGVSGGVDSTYVAFRVKKLGLRPLAVHLDNGWDSELAVWNIERALKALNIELYTHVIDWEEFKDLQLSFLKSSTPDLEIPSDHAIFAIMRIMARRIGVGYVIGGMNARTESHLPSAWSRGHSDWGYIKGVHKRFGAHPLNTYPHMTRWSLHRFKMTQHFVNILNYVDYVKQDAMTVIEKELGWRYYGGKHYESIYTRFYQGYILPNKFGFDKRRTHLSSLVCSGEITKSEALTELEKAPYPLDLMEEDKVYVIKKLGLSVDEFEGLMRLPNKTYWDYPSYGRNNQNRLYKASKSLYHLFLGRNNNGVESR